MRIKLFRFWLILAIIISTISLPTVGIAQFEEARCNRPLSMVTDLGKSVLVQKSFAADSNKIEISADVSHKYLRARIKVESPPACNNWFITVRDGQHRVVQTLNQKDFIDSNTRWTVRVPGTLLVLNLYNCKDSTASRIGLDEYIKVPNLTSTYYSSQVETNPRYVSLFPSNVNDDKALGEFVGFLMSSFSIEEGDHKNWSGSGVMIAEDLFLTNWHCGRPDIPGFPDDKVWNDEIVKETIIDLSWDGDKISREYQAVKVIKKSKDLDYALLEVRPISSIGPARGVPISLAGLHDNQRIKLIHHPLALEKQISECNINDLSYSSWMENKPGVDFTHKCDTQGGSSGAPVFNSQGQLIGIHHRGFIFDRACKPDKLNKAINIQKIVADLPGNVKIRLTYE
jgi:hypothetical protein